MFKKLLYLSISALVTASCGKMLPPGALAGQTGTPQLLRLFQTPDTQPESYQLLTDKAEIFPKIYETLRSANHKIQLNIFLFGGQIGHQIADILIAKQQAGVAIQFVTDANLGALPSFQDQIIPVIDKLLDHKIPVKGFPVKTLPKDPSWLSNTKVINHMKLMVVDDSKAVLGGMNWVDSEADNRDYMVYIEGPPAKSLGGLINKDWWISPVVETDKHPDFKIRNVSPMMQEEPVQVTPRLKIGETWINQRSARQLVLDSISQAHESIYIEMFMMDEPEVVEALVNAKYRGVKVRILLDKVNLARNANEVLEDIPIQGLPNLAAIQRFLQHGIEVGWYVPRKPDTHEKLHAKSMVIDGQKVLMGSTNMTLRALWKNREMLVAIDDPQLAGHLSAEYQEDWEQRKESVKALTTWQKTLAWGAQTFLERVFKFKS